MTPDDPRHGTRAGYKAHLKAGQSACSPCLRAQAMYQNVLTLERMAGKVRRIPVIGSRRRIQALVAMGHTMGSIAAAMGHETQQSVWNLAHRDAAYIRTSTAAKVSRVYGQLSMRPPAQRTRSERQGATYARNVAKKYGWLPPLAWDDIDDPNETPTDWAYREPTRADVLAELDEQGANMHEVLRQLGIARQTFERWCLRHDCYDLYRRLLDRNQRAA